MEFLSEYIFSSIFQQKNVKFSDTIDGVFLQNMPFIWRDISQVSWINNADTLGNLLI
jgi:hypothetical protein